MAIRATHELHKRRLSRNVGVAGLLVAMIAVFFGLTVAKVSTTGAVEGFDHVVRPSLLEVSE
ncbi:MAG: hypothetical protein AAF771_14385 [Pseudomonadota bacterium]